MNFLGVRWGRIYYSIAVRVVVLATIGIVLANLGRAYLGAHYLSKQLSDIVLAQQLEHAKGLANDIVLKIALRKATLERVAAALPSTMLHQPQKLQEWLRVQQQGLDVSLFDAMTVERHDGAVLAAYPDKNWLFQVAKGGESPALRVGRVNGVPALSMTQPIPASAGSEGLYLRAEVALAVRSFSDITHTHKNGVTGRHLLVFTNEQLFIDLSAPNLQLQPVPVPGKSPLFELGVTGAQLLGPAVDTYGQNVLAASAPINGLPWVVIATMPTTEALALIENWIDFVKAGAPYFLAVSGMYAGLMGFFLLRPLGRAARLADQMTLGQTPLMRLPVVRPDEIGALTAAFNRLLDRLDEQAKQLHAQKELAEDAALAKSRFLAAASHDLRQPMHALNLYLGALDHFDLPDVARPAMASARECAQTMDEMFRALLDISKLDASSMQANISTFAIGPLLEKIKNGFVQQARAKGLELRVAPCSAFVSSDPELLERMLANLVSNAVRYTEHGQVLLGCRRTALGLRVGVYDTGPGIAADQQRAVFEEFYQVGNPERDRSQGLGLGLAIVQRLGVLLNAPVALSSQIGKGSVFSIEVPRAEPHTTEPLAAVYALRGQHASLHGALIAVIDDEPQILDATSLVLRQWGCTVITASSGAEAVERLSLSDRAPDVIVCDHRLRGTETGVDVIAALRVEFNLEIPALLITGDTSPQRIQSMAVTGISVLNKPLQDHVLKDALLLLLLLNQLPMA
jgi:signal transduction histidine kinase